LRASHDFEEILDQAVAMPQPRGRLTYRTIKRQFDLDDEALEDLKAELLFCLDRIAARATLGREFRSRTLSVCTAGYEAILFVRAMVEHPAAYNPLLAPKQLTQRAVVALDVIQHSRHPARF
jgi:hypothetical protein